MKTRKTYIAMFLGLFIMCFSGIVKSQNCGLYYPMVNGAVIEMASYNANDQLTGTTTSTISNVVTTTDGTSASIQSTAKDKKDAVTNTSSCSVKCSGGSIFVDMKSYVPQQSQDQWKNMSVKTDAGQLEIPQTLTVGMTLKDASVTVTVYNNGTLFSTMKINITNRVVASQESVTTAAGTFNCYKITQDFKMENIVMGMTIPITMKSIEYYAAGTGMVKSQSFDKNGKLAGYTLLTKITKP
ncbi:MAG: hypothetical protein ABR968_00600 [Bacteroidales bacterium]|jgi:hypothetical protein